MNRYYIEVISSSQKVKRVVEANGMAWSESGLYEFWVMDNTTGRRIAVAYYPVNRTIVEQIEYNIDETNQ
jgi:sugar lactone lactonase YvrE